MDWGARSVAGKSILAFRRGEEQPNPSIKCFAFVQTYDEKPKRRLFELLQSQGLQMNQQIEFLSDGGDTVRDVQLYLSPEADHLLDWFHITMRLTTMTQSARGLPEKMGEEEPMPLRDEVGRQLERKMFHMCWALSDGLSKLISIDEQPNHQIVHLFRLGKTQRATHEPLDPGPEIDVLALDFLRIFLAHVVFLGIDMPLVGSPAIRVKLRGGVSIELITLTLLSA